MSDEDKIKKIKQESWGGAKPYFDLSNPQEEEVQILPDKSISPGMFKPNPSKQSQYFAHPTTIKALKKNIFLAGNDWEGSGILTEITCSGCKRKLDKDFWHFCPFCETQFEK